MIMAQQAHITTCHAKLERGEQVMTQELLGFIAVMLAIIVLKK